MKSKDIGKRITALLVCCLVCVVTAAAVNYSPWTGTVTGKNNIKYHGRTSINASRGLVSSTATILTTDSTKVPAGYVKAKAELYRGPGLAAYSNEITNGSLSTGITATTTQASGAGTYRAEGTTWFMNTDDELESLELESVSLTMSARSANDEDKFNDEEETRSGYDVSELTSEELLLSCQDNEFLSEIDGTRIDKIWFSSEEMKIGTNENGNTYGEALFVKHAGLDVDLISAIGKNGVTGYIWRSSLPGNENYVPANEVPIYANDGVTVIDSMLVGSDSTTDVDVTE